MPIRGQKKPLSVERLNPAFVARVKAAIERCLRWEVLTTKITTRQQAIDVILAPVGGRPHLKLYGQMSDLDYEMFMGLPVLVLQRILDESITKDGQPVPLTKDPKLHEFEVQVLFVPRPGKFGVYIAHTKGHWTTNTNYLGTVRVTAYHPEEAKDKAIERVREIVKQQTDKMRQTMAGKD